jgi:hypothetical protein
MTPLSPDDRDNISLLVDTYAETDRRAKAAEWRAKLKTP